MTEARDGLGERPAKRVVAIKAVAGSIGPQAKEAEGTAKPAGKKATPVNDVSKVLELAEDAAAKSSSADEEKKAKWVCRGGMSIVVVMQAASQAAVDPGNPGEARSSA